MYVKTRPLKRPMSDPSILFREHHGSVLIPAIARTLIIRGAGSTQVGHHAPDGIQSCLHRTFYPGRSPTDAVTSQKYATLLGWHILLHEMTTHPVVIPIVPRKCTLERAQKIRVV